MQSNPRLVKHSDIAFSLAIKSAKKETTTIFEVLGQSLPQILSEIDDMRTPGQPDKIVLHRDSGKHICRVDWITYDKCYP